MPNSITLLNVLVLVALGLFFLDFESCFLLLRVFIPLWRKGSNMPVIEVLEVRTIINLRLNLLDPFVNCSVPQLLY